MAISGPLFACLYWIAFLVSPLSKPEWMPMTLLISVFAIVFMFRHAYRFECEARKRQTTGAPNPYRKAGLPIRRVFLVASGVFLTLDTLGLLNALFEKGDILLSLAMLARMAILALFIIVLYLRNFDPPPKTAESEGSAESSS